MSASDWLPALISSVTGLAGVGIGVIVNSRAQERERQGRDRRELRAALAHVGEALDGIVFELRTQPRTRPAMQKFNEWISKRAPELDFPRSEMGVTMKVGPTTFWVVSPQRFSERFDRLAFAINQLAPVAPAPILDDVLQASALIGKFPHAGHEKARKAWDQQWDEARGRIAAAAREVAAPPKRPRRRLLPRG